MASAFTLLHQSILNSSIWVKESKETRIVWITLLAMKDKDGVVRSSLIGLADRAKLTLDETKSALLVLMSPDKDDTSGVDEGRRIREADHGWQIVNHEIYRYSDLEKREMWRQQQAEYRSRKTKRRAKADGSSLWSELSPRQQEQFGSEENYLQAREDQCCEPNQIPVTEAERGMTMKQMIANRKCDKETEKSWKPKKDETIADVLRRNRLALQDDQECAL